MKIGEIKDKIRSLKKDYKKIETNFYPGILDDEQEATLLKMRKPLFLLFRNQIGIVLFLLLLTVIF